ncbi:MAG: SDR family oxidoreductase [Emcibacter sp.]|nr:SDR family oxidoreductase [Emcibacter sp.]
MTQKLFCFGLGYSAHHLISFLKQQKTSWQFSGTTQKTTPNPIPHIDYHIFNNLCPLPHASEILSDVTHILISIPPQDQIGDPVLHHHRTEIAKLKNLKWVGYLSTTGVYGDRNGDWVNDDTPPAPTSLRGDQRLKAEQDWQSLSHIPVNIFRLGSIYGPNKGSLMNIMSGKINKIVKEGQYFSRIHVDDIVQSLYASMTSSLQGQIYNVVDDLPASNADVLDYICNLLGREPLPSTDFKDAEMSPIMASFYSENKRVCNDRIKQDLGIALKYPTYKQGFKALIND